MGGPAHLRVRGGTAWFTITDTGPGIAADDLPHLFQPLYRGDRSRGAGTGGTGLGLGLAIAHRVVTARDGTLVAGNTLTGGASFTATLPSSCPGQGTIGRRVDHPARGRALPMLSLWANKYGVSTESPADVGLPQGRLEEIERVFAALSHEVRRHVLLLLSHRGGELPSGYLAQRFAHSWPTTTRHLRVLEAAGLVSVRREGRNCIYRLERERLRNFLGDWQALLDPQTPEQTWRSSGPRSVTKGAQR